MPNIGPDPSAHAIYDFATMPKDAILRGVDAECVLEAGRHALRVGLAPAVRTGVMGVDFGDEPTFVLLPNTFTNGILEVDVLSRLAPDAPDFARGFIGLAYRVRGEGEGFESVYVRPTNGKALAPPPPRDRRAIQYFVYPDWKFDRLRVEHPDGGYEAGAEIEPGRWIRLRLVIDGARVQAFVDGHEVLDVTETKAAPCAGRVGLWVDIGTDGLFSNLRITPR